MPQRLRRLLHRAVDFVANSRHARRQAGRLRCIQLDEANRCQLFGKAERPEVCRRLKPEIAMCGADRAEALRILGAWELATR